MNEVFLICPVCQTENAALRRTCVSCGQSLVIVCPRCYTINAVTAAQCLASASCPSTPWVNIIIARNEVRLEDRFSRQGGHRQRCPRPSSTKPWDQHAASNCGNRNASGSEYLRDPEPPPPKTTGTSAHSYRRGRRGSRSSSPSSS